MASIINASTLAPGLVHSGDASGVLQLQSDGVTGITVTGANVAISGNLSLTNLRSTSANTAPIIQDVDGNEIGTLCRAWVNFDGTGTPAIRAAFNVSSITDIGVGTYYVNFVNAMPDTNYAVVASGRTPGVSVIFCSAFASATSNSFVSTNTTASSNADATQINVAIFK